MLNDIDIKKILDILQKMYDMCLQNKDDENKAIWNNFNRLEEINVLLESIEKDIDFNYHFFSPRSNKKLFDEQMKKYEEEKKKIKYDNEVHQKKLDQITEQINSIVDMISKMKEF